MPDLEPITRDEMLWSGEDVKPITRREMYIRHLYDETQVIPDKPITREEMFILKAGEELHDVTIEQLNVSENGTYSESGKAYSPVIVNVPAPPLPENAYLLKEVEDLPKDIATFSDGANLPMPSLKVSIEPIQSGSGDPSPTNVRPISGRTEAEVSVCGVNVWDEEWEQGYIYNGNNYNATDRIRSKNYIPCIPNTTYCYVCGGSATINIFYYDVNKTYISTEGASSGQTRTTPSNAYYIRFYMGTAYGNTYNNDISINYPSTDTQYHAYNGHTTTIPFLDSQGNPVEVYGGECDVVNGANNIETHKGVKIKDLSWTRHNSGFFYALPSDMEINDMAICSVYKNTFAIYSSLEDKTMSTRSQYISTNQAIIMIKDTDYADVSEFTTAMGEQTILYKLSTPSTFNTQPTSIKSNDGVNNVWGDCGQIDELEYWSKEA